MERVARERPHGVVFNVVDILAEPARIEEQIGEQLLVNFGAVVGGAQRGEVGLDGVILRPIVDRLVGDPGVLIGLVGDAIDHRITIAADDGHRIGKRGRSPRAVVDHIMRVPRNPAQGLRRRCCRGRAGLRRRVKRILALEVADGSAALDHPYGPADVFKHDALHELRIRNHRKRDTRQKRGAGRSGVGEVARDITRR